MPFIADTFHLDNDVDYEFFEAQHPVYGLIRLYRGISERAKARLRSCTSDIKHPGFILFKGNVDDLLLANSAKHQNWTQRQIDPPK